MPPVWLATARLVTGFAATAVLLAGRKQLTFPQRKDWPFIVSIGFVQMGLYQLFVNYGMVHVHVGRAAMLIYATPLWVTPIAILFFGEKATPLKLLGLILGISGILLLFSPTHFDWHHTDILIGNGFLLLASFCWAVAILHIRYGEWHSAPLQLLPWQLLLGSILPLILASVTEPFRSIHWHFVLIGIILFSSILATAFGYWCSIIISKTLPVMTTSLALLNVPVLSLLLSHWFLGEPLTTGSITAMSLIMIGLICVTLQYRIQTIRE